MTNAETIERLEEMQDIFRFLEGGKRSETIDNAIKAVKKISHLTDKPCTACEFHKENGCSEWNSVFDVAFNEAIKEIDKEYPQTIYEYLVDNSFKDEDGRLLIQTAKVKEAVEHYYERRNK